MSDILSGAIVRFSASNSSSVLRGPRVNISLYGAIKRTISSSFMRDFTALMISLLSRILTCVLKSSIERIVKFRLFSVEPGPSIATSASRNI